MNIDKASIRPIHNIKKLKKNTKGWLRMIEGAKQGKPANNSVGETTW
jgi:hypothetical protein